MKVRLAFSRALLESTGALIGGADFLQGRQQRIEHQLLQQLGDAVDFLLIDQLFRIGHRRASLAVRAIVENLPKCRSGDSVS